MEIVLTRPNCKKLTRIVGIDSADSLESPRIGLTNCELNEILSHLPASLKALSLHSPRKAINDKLQPRIASLGLPPAYYIEAP